VFRDHFVSILKDSPYKSFRWETPPVTLGEIDKAFEFVMLDDPYLTKKADPSAFSEYFQEEASNIVIFPNLGKDAILIVPTPKKVLDTYAHLASFLRRASDQQIHDLWKAIGETMKKRVHEKPIWLSTAGGGVPWLHIRLDSHPKYYLYHSYRRKDD
jgi:hypothetical protein